LEFMRKPRRRSACAALLLAASVAAKPKADARTVYLSALRRTLQLSPVGGNHSAEPGLLRAAAPIQPQALALVVPPRHVYTVQKCLGIVGYINKCSRSLPRTLPRRFVLAAFVLHERFVAPRGGLMRLWLESLPPLDSSCLWSDAELELLDDTRAVHRSRSCRDELRDEYDRMMSVLLDEGGSTPPHIIMRTCRMPTCHMRRNDNDHARLDPRAAVAQRACGARARSRRGTRYVRRLLTRRVCLWQWPTI
jgi:hypothetical protein